MVNYSNSTPDNQKSISLKTFDHYFVTMGDWHQISNPFDAPCHIIEIQYGEACVEDDILRFK